MLPGVCNRFCWLCIIAFPFIHGKKYTYQGELPNPLWKLHTDMSVNPSQVKLNQAKPSQAKLAVKLITVIIFRFFLLFLIYFNSIDCIANLVIGKLYNVENVKIWKIEQPPHTSSPHSLGVNDWILHASLQVDVLRLYLSVLISVQSACCSCLLIKLSLYINFSRYVLCEQANWMSNGSSTGV